MANDYHIGQNVRVGVAINAEVAGMTFGETPGTYDCMKLVTGGAFKVEHRNAKVEVDEVDVDPTAVVVGGLIHTITVDVVMSYSYREKFFQLLMGGAIATVGAASPWTHTPALVDKLLNGSIFVEYTKQSAQANHIIRETYNNFVVSAISLKASPEGYAVLSVSGVSTALVRVTNQASLTTVNETEPLEWDHLSVVLDGATTVRCGDVGFDLGASLAEGEFDHAPATPAVQDGNWRKGPRTVGWNVVTRQDDSAYSLRVDVGAMWAGANSFTWNNAAAVGANRQFIIVFGDSYLDSVGDTAGVWGRFMTPLSLKALSGTTPRIAVDFINGRSTIPA